MSDQINVFLKDFFSLHPDLDPGPENRGLLLDGIQALHRGVISGGNLQDVWLRSKEPFKKKKTLPPVVINHDIWHEVARKFPWVATEGKSGEDNLWRVVTWIQNNSNGAFNAAHVEAAIRVLGPLALASPPPPVAAPPEPEAPPVFEWNSVLALKDVPLVSPIDGSKPPAWFLNRLSRDQIRSYVRREAEANKPAPPGLREDQLALDATPEEMLAAKPSQLHDLVRRRQAAKLI